MYPASVFPGHRRAFATSPVNDGASGVETSKSNVVDRLQYSSEVEMCALSAGDLREAATAMA